MGEEEKKKYKYLMDNGTKPSIIQRGNVGFIFDDKGKEMAQALVELQIDKKVDEAKHLTEKDMREIEQAQARKDVQESIYRSQMIMATVEAEEKQEVWKAREEVKAKAPVNEEKEAKRQKFLDDLAARKLQKELDKEAKKHDR